MVESEAKELSEEIMLGAVMSGHRGFQPVIDAIIRLAERAAKEPRDFVVRRHDGRREAPSPQIAEAELREAYKITDKQERYAAVDAVKAKVTAALFPEGGEAEVRQGRRSARSSRSCRPRSSAGTSSTPASASTAATSRPSARSSSEVGVLPRTHGSALFTRGETQALVVATLGTGEDEQYRRLARGHLQGALPAPLQLPSLLRRRDRPHGFARPPRNRPRQARLARHPSDAAGRRRVPLHDPRRLRDHRVQRLVVDGDRLRRLAGADGRGRSAEARRRPASPWA